MNEVFNAVETAVKTLKSELNEDSFEFRFSDMSPTIEVIDLNCEEEHEDLDKIYMIGYHAEDGSFGLHFESSLSYKSTFKKEHAAKLIEADIDFEIYKHRLQLEKADVDLEDLAKNVKLMAEILFNF
jgi:hypothetical protein